MSNCLQPSTDLSFSITDPVRNKNRQMPTAAESGRFLVSPQRLVWKLTKWLNSSHVGSTVSGEEPLQPNTRIYNTLIHNLCISAQCRSVRAVKLTMPKKHQQTWFSPSGGFQSPHPGSHWSLARLGLYAHGLRLGHRSGTQTWSHHTMIHLEFCLLSVQTLFKHVISNQIQACKEFK